MQIDFQKAFDELDVWVKDVKRSVINQAARRTMNRVKKTLVSETSKEIRKNRKIKAGDLKRKYLKATASTRGKDPFKYFANLRISERPVNLLHFKKGSKLPQSQKGKKVKRRKKLRFEVTPGRTTKREHDFIARGKNNNLLVFRRVGKKRVPIKSQKVSSHAALVMQDGVKSPILAKVSKAAQTEFVRNLKYYLAKSVEKAKMK